MAADPRPSRPHVVALWILAVVALLFFLRAASQLLIPIVIGVLISYALEPVVGWLARHGIPRLAGTSLVMVGLLGLCGWGVYSLRDDVQQAVAALPDAARRAREIVMSQSGSGVIASLEEAASILRGTSDGSSGAPETSSETTAVGDSSREASGRKEGDVAEPAASAEDDRAQETGPLPAGTQGAATLIQRGVGSMLALVGHLTVIFFLVFFLLLSGHHFRDRLVEIAGTGDQRRTTAAIIDDINGQIQRFLLVRLVTAAIVGALTWGVLAWMDVPNAVVWGLLAGVFNSIPYFGPVIVSGGLLIVGLVQGGGLVQALQMSGAALVITSLEGWLLEPPLMGKAERMSAIAVFLGLLLWTWVWGAWGTILAVPMLVVLKSVADKVGSLKPIGRLMAP